MSPARSDAIPVASLSRRRDLGALVVERNSEQSLYTPGRNADSFQCKNKHKQLIANSSFSNVREGDLGAKKQEVLMHV